ncbi:hypothetical protein ACHAW6_008193 [Cyclotella cf. meneghiniana]
MSSTQPMSASTTPLAIDDILPSATPTLKVMRLQAPQLGQPSAGQLLSSTHLLSSSLMLPDSFGVIHVGETFSAYLGVLNPSFDLPVRGLTVAVQLQTPSKRIVLPSRLDGNDASSSTSTNDSSSNNQKDVEPGGGVDAIVSRRLEEVGQHILRVEVGYIANGAKTLRKFYRFNVSVPLTITEKVTRSGDSKCLVSITVENVMEKQTSGEGAVTISSVGFEPPQGLVSKQVLLDESERELDKITRATSKVTFGSQRRSALEMYDGCGRLEPGESCRYLFYVMAESEAAALRGIAFGDELGQACLTYYKAMGESGKIYSSTVVCPPTTYAENATSNSKFVVYGSGLSVDVAAASVQRSSSGRRNSSDSRGTLDELLPVTVEPIDPPSRMKLSVPKSVALLIVNHSSRPMSLQLQMRLPNMNGVVICGPSFITLGELPPSGGSCTIDVNFVALVAGLFSVQGCYVVDMTTGMEIQQPALFNVFVELPNDRFEEKKTVH